MIQAVLFERYDQICMDISICVFCIWLQKPPLESFFDVWKAVIFGHGHFRSFSKMIRSFGSIVYINIYLYNTYRGDLRPRKRKWPKMTVTENDRIRLLKVIRKEAMCDCNMMIITKLAYVVVSACTMFCIVGTAHIPLLSTPVFLLFLWEFWQNISRNSLFLPLSFTL